MKSLYPFGPQNTLSLVESEISMYCTFNFKTKKALKEAAAKRMRWLELQVTQNALCASGMDVGAVLSNKEFPNGEPPAITFWQRNNMFGVVATINGVQTVEGPHFPAAHRWAAHCHLKDGEVVKVT